MSETGPVAAFGPTNQPQALWLKPIRRAAVAERSSDKEIAGMHPIDVEGLICFWDFQPRAGDHLTSRGAHAYALVEQGGPIARADEGVFGPSSLCVECGQWLRIAHEDCPALDRGGKRSVSVIAWVKRQTDGPWQYIAGKWNERDSRRQYCLLSAGHRQAHHNTLERSDARYQPHGYVSDVGGATRGKPYCFTYATGGTRMPRDGWTMVGFAWDGHDVRVYTNGELDHNGTCNPFAFDRPLFGGSDTPIDFTVAQRALPAWPTYPDGPIEHGEGFAGLIGGIGVYDRALTASEYRALFDATRDACAP